jgi:hypothetical protein
LLAGAALPVAAHGQCVTDAPEAAGTNALFPSVPGGVNWVANGPVQPLGGSVVAPDGSTSTTSRLMASDTTNNFHAYARSGVPITPNAAFTVSVFMKRDGFNGYIQVNPTGGGGYACVAYYDLVAGTGVVGADLAAGGSNKSVSVTSLPNGWYRVSFTFTDTGNNTSVGVYIGPCVLAAPTGDNRSFSGVVGTGLYFWGAQVEQGGLTSYIPTTSAAVTRPVGLLSMSPTLKCLR